VWRSSSGFDAGKKVNGRKRHIAVGTLRAEWTLRLAHRGHRYLDWPHLHDPDALVVAEVAQLRLVGCLSARGRPCRRVDGPAELVNRGRNVKADVIRWLLRPPISCPA
jgi:hypothetical protein